MKALTLILLASATCFISCKAKDSDKVGDAQYCLDTATAATVQTCVDKVAGLETPSAYIIRCSANFIQNGFGTSQQIVDTFQNLKNTGSGSTTGFLSALNFDGNTELATTTFNNCVKTNQKALSMLAAMVKSATTIAGLAGLNDPNNPPTPAQLQTAIQGLVGDPAAQQAVGEAVSTVYQNSCQNGSQVNTTLCTQISDALVTAGSPAPAALGAALLALWQNQ